MRLSTNHCVSNLGKGVLLALALLMLLAACSDGGESDTTAPTVAPPAPTVAPPTPTVSPPTPTVAPPTPTSEPATPTAQAMPETMKSEPISVVVTTNIVADWVENIGGEHVDVFSLLPVGADPHTFQPGAQAVARVADADLVLSIGLGLEESWLHDLLENAARDESAIVELGEIIDPIEFASTHAEEVELLEGISHIVHEVEEGEISPEEGLDEVKELVASIEEMEEEEGEHEGEEELPEHVMEIVAEVEDGSMGAEEAIEELEHLAEEGEGEHEGHGHGIHDPHFWFDPLRVKVAANDIAARLSELDPDRADTFSANTSAYNEQLDELHAWTEEQTDLVPNNRKLLVTSHDSLGYFANLYGFEVVGVILSTTTEVEPSAADLAELIHEIEEYSVPAIFGETTVNERLAETVAAESGAKVVRLFSGSLGPEDSDAATYLEMIRTNVDRIVEALK